MQAVILQTIVRKSKKKLVFHNIETFLVAQANKMEEVMPGRIAREMQ